MAQYDNATALDIAEHLTLDPTEGLNNTNNVVQALVDILKGTSGTSATIMDALKGEVEGHNHDFSFYSNGILYDSTGSNIVAPDPSSATTVSSTDLKDKDALIVVGDGNGKTVTLNDASSSTVKAVYLTSDATGTLTLTNSDDIAVVLDGVKNTTVSTSGGNDNIAVAGGSGNTIKTGSGADNILVYKDANGTVASDITIDTGSGNDKVILQAVSTATVNVGEGTNTVQVEVAGTTASKNVDITAAVDSSNTVTITGGSGNSFAHADSRHSSYTVDTVTLTDTESATVTLGDANNKVTLNGATKSTVTLGDGTNTIILNTSDSDTAIKDVTIEAGDGVNDITVNDKVTGTTITTGANNDNFILNLTNLKSEDLSNTDLTIDAGDGHDTLVLKVASDTISSPEFTYSDGTWAIKGTGISLTSVENVAVNGTEYTLPSDGSSAYVSRNTIKDTDKASREYGDGNYEVTVTNSDNVNLTFGDGDNTLNVYASETATVTMGDGSNDVTFNRSEGATVTVGDGDGNDLSFTRSGGATVTVGDGDGNTVTSVHGGESNITIGNGDGNTVTLSGLDDHSTVTVGNGNSNIINLAYNPDLAPDLDRGIVSNATVTVGNGNDNTINLEGAESAKVTLGTGHNTIYFKPVNTGGTEKVYVTGTTITAAGANEVHINGGSNNSYTSTGKAANYNTGDVANDVYVENGATNTSINTDGGDDHFTIDADTLKNGSVTINAGAGEDTVYIYLKADDNTDDTAMPTFTYSGGNWTIDGTSISLTDVEEVVVTDSKGIKHTYVLPEDGSAAYEAGEQTINGVDNVEKTYGDENHNVAVNNSNNATLTFGNGNNDLDLLRSDNATVIMGDGDNDVSLLRSDNANINLGNGDNNVTLRADSIAAGTAVDGSDNAQITAGNGDNTFTLYNSDKATITVKGDGDNTFTLADTEVRDGQTISGAGATNSILTVTGNGDNSFDVVEGSNNTLAVTGDGDNVFDVTGGSVNAIKVDSKGHNTATITKSSEAKVEFTGKGNNEVTLTRSDSATVTVGDGANKLTLERSNDATLTLGNGANVVMLDRSDDVAATFGDGDNDLTMSHVNGTGDDATEITFGDGANTVDVIGVTNYALTLGNGGNTVNLTNGDDGTVTDGVTVTTGEGADSIFVDDAVSNSTLNVGAGDDKIVLSDDALSGATKLTIDGGDGNDVLQIFTDTNFTRLSTGHVQVQGNTNIDLENINAILTTDADGKNGTMKIVLSSDEDTAAAQTTVAKLYALTLGRTALDADTNAVNNIDGFNYWVDRVTAQEDSQTHLVASFVDSAEFRANHSGMTSAELVQSIYNSSEATLDEETLDNFVARLDAEDITDAGKVEVLTEAVQNALTSNIQLAGVQMDQYLLGSDAGTTSEPEEEILPTNDTTPEDTVA